MGLYNLVLSNSEMQKLKEAMWPYRMIYGRNAKHAIVEVIIPSEIENKLNIKDMRGDLDLSLLWD